MDDLEPFESPKLLIESAKESIPQFDVACKSFLERSTYDVTDHFNPNTGETTRKLRFHHRIPGGLRVFASRILNDLRHALTKARPAMARI